jgi:hypothetical protein
LAGMSMISGLSGEDPERQIEAKAPSLIVSDQNQRIFSGAATGLVDAANIPAASADDVSPGGPCRCRS